MLAAAGIEEPLREARILERNAPDAATFARYVERRAKREPTAYILGRKEFWSLDFEVSPAVLIPRPDSETLVDAALAQFKNHRPPQTILDLGTGSGCLLIALLSEWPQARGLGVDISPEALAIARRNAVRLVPGERAQFHQGDWTKGLDRRFDLIVSNPPYITSAEMLSLDEDVAGFEPRGALLGGDDGLEPLRRIAEGLKSVMQPQAVAIIELGIDQAASAGRILVNAGLEVLNIAKDLGGRDRAIVARLPHNGVVTGLA